jgi:hypothetical protein
MEGRDMNEYEKARNAALAHICHCGVCIRALCDEGRRLRDHVVAVLNREVSR